MSATTSSKNYSVDRPYPLERIAEFCSFLRENEIEATTHDAELMMELLLLAGVVSGPVVEQLWRPVACRSLKDWRAWPALFNSFWFPGQFDRSDAVVVQSDRYRTIDELAEQSRALAESSSAAAQVIGDGVFTSDTDEQKEQKKKSHGGASSLDPSGKKIQSTWNPTDLRRLERLAIEVRARLFNSPTRRWEASYRGRSLDLRKTIQSVMRFAGDGIQPGWRRRRRKVPQILMVLDVSRSMESYAESYIRLARAFSRWLPLRVFLFHVKHAEVTPFLSRDNPRIQEKIDSVTAGFQGGTKIASSLKTICFGGDVSLSQRTKVWIFSDGYDTDDSDELLDVLKRVRGRGATIDWFYPNKTVADMSQGLRLVRPLVKGWHTVGNLGEVEESFGSLS